MSRRARDIMVLLKEDLERELPTFTLTEGTSANDERTLLISEDATPAASEEVAFVLLKPRSYSGFPTSTLAQDGVEPDGRPHLMQVVVESSTTAGISVWSSINFAKLMARLLDQNVELELYLSANTDVPAEGEITDANLDGVIQTDPRHPNNGQ